VVFNSSLIILYFSVPKQPKSAWSVRNPEQSTLETVYFGDRQISAVSITVQTLIHLIFILIYPRVKQKIMVF